MSLTWPQLHPMNYQFFRSVKNYLINSPEISNWMFDGYQSNVLFGFKLIDQGIFEPVLLNLPDLQKQHLAQFPAAAGPANLDPSGLWLAQDQVCPQNHLCTDSLIDQDVKETEQKEDVDPEPHPALEIWKHFDQIDDPRADANRKHKLSDIITIAILAVICGADHWTQIERFATSKVGWLSTFLELPYGIPSHDTFNRLFAALDPDQFRAGFISWVNSISKVLPGEIIAIDGKQNRRTHDKKLGRKAIHAACLLLFMVSAWASQNQLVLGQVKVDDKSNEITAILFRKCYTLKVVSLQ